MSKPTSAPTGPGAWSLAELPRRLRDGLRARRQRLRAASWSKEDEARLRFYRGLISPGDLVFDVGANRGNRTKVFLRLARKVVAVEPQPDCVELLRKVFGSDPRLAIEETAVGSQPGTAEMTLSREASVATLDPTWVEDLSSSGRFDRGLWGGTATVPVTTLDELVRRHGRPGFVKIDVEGYEAQALAGLSAPVGALSFEFVPERRAATEACLDELDRLGEWRLQLALGEETAFAFPEWIDRAELTRRLDSAPADAFGDVYAAHVG